VTDDDSMALPSRSSIALFHITFAIQSSLDYCCIYIDASVLDLIYLLTCFYCDYICIIPLNSSRLLIVASLHSVQISKTLCLLVFMQSY